MLTLKQWMEMVDYRISEGSDYYRANADGAGLYMLTSWTGDHDGWSASIAFNPDTQKVYLVEMCDYKHNRAYCLADPALEGYNTKQQAWDDVDFVRLEADEDMLEKAEAIKAGEDYDTRVVIPMDIPEDVLYQLMLRAHEQDITLNALIGNIVEAECARVLGEKE